METGEDLAREVSRLSEGLTLALEEHLDDNFGELLPHLYFGDVTRRMIALYEGEDETAARVEIADVFSHLEKRFQDANSEIAELISDSFLENLPGPGEPSDGILEYLGPRLRKRYSELW